MQYTEFVVIATTIVFSGITNFSNKPRQLQADTWLLLDIDFAWDKCVFVCIGVCLLVYLPKG